MRIEEQLQELGRDLPIPHVDPGASLARVVRRGRVRRWVTHGVTVVMTLTSGVAAAVVVPQVIDRPTTPTVAGEVEEVTVVDDEKVVVVPEKDEVEPVADEPTAVESAPEAEAVVPVDVDTTAPEIAVLHPKDGTVSEERTIAFEGEVEPGARVFAGPYEAKVDDRGAWRIVLVLSKGRNEVTFQAKDAAGNVGEDRVTVLYEPSTATDAAFTATQVHAAKTYDPPYTSYEGTAAPGSVVKVTSKYGSASTEVGAKGHWEVKVWFSSAPIGTHTWPVTVTSKATGATATFEFTGTRPEAKDLHLTANQKWGVIDAPFENLYWGTATPGQKVKVFSDYGWSSTTADANGNWELEVVFDPPAGEKRFVVHAKLWDHPEVTRAFELTTVREGGGVAFEAHNTYGECSEAEPYDVYHGYAQPGSVVKIVSEYIAGGHVAVEANAEGRWEKKVFFDSPRDHEFSVTVTSTATGETRTFGMYVGP